MKTTLGIASLGLCFLALEWSFSSTANAGRECMKHCMVDCKINNAKDCSEYCFYCTVPEWQTPKF